MDFYGLFVSVRECVRGKAVKKYELFAEIAVVHSIIFPVTIPLSLRGDKHRISKGYESRSNLIVIA